jgi:hypothetical protein
MHQVLFRILHQNNYDLNRVHVVWYFATNKNTISDIQKMKHTSKASTNSDTSSSLNLFPRTIKICQNIFTILIHIPDKLIFRKC